MKPAKAWPYWSEWICARKTYCRFLAAHHVAGGVEAFHAGRLMGVDEQPAVLADAGVQRLGEVRIGRGPQR